MKQQVTADVTSVSSCEFWPVGNSSGPREVLSGSFIGATLRAEPKTRSGYALVKFSGNWTRGTSHLGQLIPECLWFPVRQSGVSGAVRPTALIPE